MSEQQPGWSNSGSANTPPAGDAEEKVVAADAAEDKAVSPRKTTAKKRA